MRVYSRKYPGLWVRDLGVRFRDGVADVDDPATLAALAGVDGVEVPGPAPAVDAAPSAPRPKRAAATRARKRSTSSVGDS